MDARLRSVAREVWRHPGDRQRIRRYRAELHRLEAVDPGQARAALAELEGGLTISRSLGHDTDPQLVAPPRWLRVAAGAGEPVQDPALPGGERLVERWRAAGHARWVSAAAVVLELPDRSLEARDPRGGALLWATPSCREGGEAKDEQQRVSTLPWALAPWGAVEVQARLESQLAYRRVGRHTPRGRATSREVVGRERVSATVELHLLVPPGGSWSAAPPDPVRVNAPPGQALCGGDLLLEEWEDELLALALDLHAPGFAVLWRDERRDWSVFDVVTDPGLPPGVLASEWSAPGGEDPYPLPEQPDPWLRLQAPELARAAALLPVEDGLLLARSRPGQDPVLEVWDPGAGRPLRTLSGGPGAALLEGRALRAWCQPGGRWSGRRLGGAAEPDEDAVLLACDGVLLVQAGELLVAFGAPGEARP